MGLGANITTNRPIVSSKSKIKFYSGDQSDFDAEFVRIRYEGASKSIVDRKKFTYIEARIDDVTKACAIYVDNTGWGVSIHVHAPGFFKKDFIRRILNYPFIEAKVKILLAPIRLSNISMIKITRQLGFRDYCVMPDYYGLHEDQIVLAAQESDVKKWLK